MMTLVCDVHAEKDNNHQVGNTADISYCAEMQLSLEEIWELGWRTVGSVVIEPRDTETETVLPSGDLVMFFCCLFHGGCEFLFLRFPMFRVLLYQLLRKPNVLIQLIFYLCNLRSTPPRGYRWKRAFSHIWFNTCFAHCSPINKQINKIVPKQKNQTQPS